MTRPLAQHDIGKANAQVWWRGVLTVDPGELERAVRDGWLVDGVDGWAVRQVASGRILFGAKPNLVVNSGINRRLDLEFANSAPTAVNSIGVDNGTANPIATTSQSADGNSTARTIIAMSSSTRSGQVQTCNGTFTQANVSFVMKRLFLNASTVDAAGNLHSMTNVFTIDLTAFSTWSQAFSATVTGTGS